jgi:hypothetical protein
MNMGEDQLVNTLNLNRGSTYQGKGRKEVWKLVLHAAKLIKHGQDWPEVEVRSLVLTFGHVSFMNLTWRMQWGSRMLSPATARLTPRCGLLTRWPRRLAERLTQTRRIRFCWFIFKFMLKFKIENSHWLENSVHFECRAKTENSPEVHNWKNNYSNCCTCHPWTRVTSCIVNTWVDSFHRNSDYFESGMETPWHLFDEGVKEEVVQTLQTLNFQCLETTWIIWLTIL